MLTLHGGRPSPTPRLHRRVSPKTLAGLALGALLIALAAGGCGGDEDANGGGGGGLDLESCRLTARANCETMALCRAKDFEFGTVEACEAAMASATCMGVDGTLGADYSELLSQYTGPGYAECMERQRALGPSCRTPETVTEADVEAARAACTPEKVLPPPNRALGELCLVEHQCPRGAICARPEEKGCGTCVEVREGKACERARDCGTFTGFECTSEKICARYAGPGESCETRRCNPLASLVCANDRKCTTAAKREEACDVRPCDPGLFLHCSPTTKTCKTKPRKVGEPCMPDGVCGDGLFCDRTAGTCAALLLEGASCAGIVAEAPCDPLRGLACDLESGLCKLAYTAVGQRCSESYPETPDCWQGYCKNEGAQMFGTCTAYAQSGQPCGGEAKCATFLLCIEGTCKTIAESGVFEDAGAGAAAAAEAYASCL